MKALEKFTEIYKHNIDKTYILKYTNKRNRILKPGMTDFLRKHIEKKNYIQ